MKSQRVSDGVRIVLGLVIAGFTLQGIAYTDIDALYKVLIVVGLVAGWVLIMVIDENVKNDRELEADQRRLEERDGIRRD